MEKIGLAAVLDMSDFDSNMAKYDASLEKMNQTTADAAGKVGQQFVGLGDAVNKAALVVATAFVAATAAAGAALAKFTGDGIEKAADLEKQMGGIAAVMSTTKDAVGPLKDLIQDLALDPRLKVNTTEAADAIEMLGRNGLTMGQILDGAAESTVLLANATEADFGTAADIATDVMSLFNIEAEDMNTAVDGITSVVNNSKFSIDDYRLAIAQGGGVAASVGVEFDDFNTTIAATAPLFGSGSDAGTSFKTFLQRLVPTTDTASDAMKELGLFTGMTDKEFDDAIETIGKYEKEMANIDPTTKNAAEKQAGLAEKINVLRASLIAGQNAFFDTDGSMKSMDEIAGLLQDSMSSLSEEQKIQAASTIFGTDAMRTAVGLANVGNEQFLALKTTMGNTSAEEAAATRMDNFSGTMEILQGVIEAVQIKIGERFLPTLRTLAERLTALVTENEEKLLAFFGGVAEWVGEKIPLAMDWLVKTGLPAMGQAFNYLADTVFPGIAKAIAWATENWDFLSGAIKVLAGVLVTASLVSTFAGIVAAIGPLVTLIVGAGGLVASLTGAGGMAAALVALLNPVGLVVAAVGGLALAWAMDWGNIRTGTITQVSYIGQVISGFASSINSTLAGVMASIRTGWTAAWSEIGNRVVSAGSGIVANVNTLASSINYTLAGVMGSIRSGWSTAWSEISTKATTSANGIVAGVNTLAWNINSMLASGMSSAQSGWRTAWTNLTTMVADAGMGMRSRAETAGQGAGSALSNGLAAARYGFQNTITNLAGLVTGTFRDRANDWLTAGRNIAYGIASGVGNQASGLYESMRNLGINLLGSFRNALGIRSPSTEFAAAGYDMAWGLAEGVDDGSWLVYDTIGNMADTANSMMDVAASQLAARQAQIAQEQSELRQAMQNENAAFLAKYQQETADRIAKNQSEAAIMSQWGQAQYEAYSLALQSGKSRDEAIAAGQAIPAGAQTQQNVNHAAAQAAAQQAAAAQAAATAATQALLAAQNAQRTEYNNAISAAIAPLMNNQVATLQEALKQVETAIKMVTEKYDSQQFPIESDISTMEKSIRELVSTINYGPPSGAQRDANVAQLGSLQQELEIAKIRLATLKEAREESMTPLSDRKSEIEQQMAAAVNEAARASGQRLLEEFTGLFSANRVTAALQEWQAAENIRQTALAAYQGSDGTNSTQTLQALLAANVQENAKRSALQRAKDEVAANGTGWQGIQNRMRTFVGTTLGGAPTDVVATQLANPEANPGAVNNFIGTLGKLWETATGQVADEFNMLRPLIADMVTLVNATATTSVESLRDEFDRLIAFRNTVSPAYQNLTGTALGNVSNTENNFNVTFQGSSGSNASVLQDIQFLNALYGAA